MIRRSFQSTLPRREATQRVVPLPDDLAISIHASPKGSDLVYLGLPGPAVVISIHASPKGSDNELSYLIHAKDGFQSTLPRREATGGATPAPYPQTISIHASPKGSDEVHEPAVLLHVISIHASPKGSDERVAGHLVVERISIHASPKGSDRANRSPPTTNDAFQSTLPRREATQLPSRVCSALDNFNPRFPEGKRQK